MLAHETEPTTEGPALRKEAATIQSMFAEIAPRYDLLNRVLSCNIDQRWRRRAVALARPAGPVLDVCTGTGDLAAAFVGATGEPAYGVDFCQPMLRRGRDKAACKDVRFARGDALRLPLPSNRFDVVSVAFGIRNVADLDAGLAELVRVARPGGRIAILEFTMPKRRVLGALYRFYFGRVLPMVGNLVSRSSAYTYLNRSVLEWTGEQELAERLRRAGCARVDVFPLSIGIAAVHLGVKADAG
ncbi:MAG: ubiquinone/menaquinone biosynthesis methyltransferase [Planctomycetota bacterium]|jgi:demethylmenaquinone methyltransferase/2-methoxy-6-polyprenyl-1,4-benzoquinol methylase